MEKAEECVNRHLCIWPPVESLDAVGTLALGMIVLVPFFYGSRVR